MKVNHLISLQKTHNCCSFERKLQVLKKDQATNKTKVATVTRAGVQEIAETKMPDLNAASIRVCNAYDRGTARSIGFTVTD